MGIINDLKTAFSFSKWERIRVGSDTSNVPSWVLKAYYRHRKHASPYGTFYIKGKTFEYKVMNIPDVQGGSFYVYRKLRRKD